MAPRKAAQVDASIGDMEIDQSTIAELKRPVINRKVVKPVKKRAVTMKKTQSPVAKKSKGPVARHALQDRTNILDGHAVDDLDTTAKKAKGRKGAVTTEETPVAKQRQAKKAAPKKRVASPEYLHVIPETQQVQDVSESVEVQEESMEIDEPEPEQRPAPTRKVARERSASVQRQAQPYTRVRSTSQQPRSYSREGSAALAERRLADGESRRKLADMTSKYEDMRLRYESLSELGSKAAESNFDKLKRATEQRTKDANDLITSLKKDLADARKSSSGHNAENAKLQTQLNALQSNQEQAQNELKELRRSLAESQNEAKSLTAKLEAARKAANAAAAEAARAPASNIQAREASARANAGSNLDSGKQAALKEELYRDLTGLIINSVRRRDGEDEFSCIQTGKNGTLHFHLTVNNDSNSVNPKTPSGLTFEETEFAYEPFFDEGRDRDLIDILPDYLTEEICFPRLQAVKFYTKVVDSMNKRVEVMDE